MTYAIETVFGKAITQLERERRRLSALDQARQHLVQDLFDSDGVSAMSRALTYVVCGGILEQLMRDLPQALSTDLVAKTVLRSQLPAGLLAILEASEFKRCATSTTSTLSVRASLIRSIAGHGSDNRLVSDFAQDLIIADGTTITTRHFKVLWDVLELPGDWRNDAKDQFLVSEISSKRNDVAHWEMDPVDVGRSKSYSDLLSSIDALIKLVDHIHLHIWDWLDQVGAAKAKALTGTP
ncbi:hypothetical protein [Catellatospora chokoriensis]|uniref:RiboL-PSP-HEPN domain-containing protein n=1 Tax=Catellatospora chokoriensis TaxID=310353 RepID=A0A8J3JZD5_9ACTN|nr:hypothetical protein [Catellatospora chokoriensis]GIF90016.1 hypothetical protein Cch02nite_34600 [Catellatospora chokoriensis]